MSDPHGYDQLLSDLRQIAKALHAEGRDADVMGIERVMKFAGGSPFEFLGESRIVLERLL